MSIDEVLLQRAKADPVTRPVVEKAEAASKVIRGDTTPQERAAAPVVGIVRAARAVVPAVGPKHAAVGIKRTSKAVRSAARGLPNADWTAMERAGIVEPLELADTARGQFKPGKPLATAPAGMLMKPDEFARAVAYLATLNKARDDGESAASASKQAKATAQSVADMPPRKRAPHAVKQFVKHQVRREYRVPQSGLGKLLVELHRMAAAGQAVDGDILEIAMDWLRVERGGDRRLADRLERANDAGDRARAARIHAEARRKGVALTVAA